MSSAKTTNTTLALAISTVLASASSQATPVAANYTSHSTVFNNNFRLRLADNQIVQVPLPQANVEQQQSEAFENSKYTSDDAKLLSMYWDLGDFSNAKLYIGSLLLSGDDAAIQQVLQQAQLIKRQDEAFWNSKYTFNDLEILANFWGKNERWDAKLKLGSLLLGGRDAEIQQALQQAANQPAQEAALPQANVEQSPANASTQQWEAYSNSKYTYDDAELLAEHWGKPEPWDAKLKIGSLLMSGDDAAIQKALQQAGNNQAIQQARQQRQQQARAEEQQEEAFLNSKYTYEDAERLAEYWGKPYPWNAKLKIGSLLLGGKDAEIQQALLELRQWNTYSNSKYTYDDAEGLAEHWGKPEPWDAKLKIGSILMSGDDAAIQKALQQANQKAEQQKHD
jgi:ribosomal protein L16/L10AE